MSLKGRFITGVSVAVSTAAVLSAMSAGASGTPYGPYNVGGAIEVAYLNTGGPGKWGNPTSPEMNAGNAGNYGRFQKFGTNSFYWHSAVAGGNAKQVGGSILSEWGTYNWEKGTLGYPTSHENSLSKYSGKFNTFQNGSIYYSSTTGAHPVWGAVRDKWGATGWENGPLGYPTTDEIYDGPRNTYAQTFEGGKVVYTSTHGAHTVTDPILNSIEQYGTPVESSITYHNPTSDAYIPWGGGIAQDFANAGTYTYRQDEFEWGYDLTFYAGSHGSYNTDGASLSQVRQSLVNCFDCMFPVIGADDYPQVGDIIELTAAGLVPAPVKVIQSDPNLPRWTFEALDGHFDGSGSIVAFEFIDNGDGVDLHVKAGVVNSYGTYPANLANMNVAAGYWQSFIDRVGLYMCYDWDHCET